MGSSERWLRWTVGTLSDLIFSALLWKDRASCSVFPQSGPGRTCSSRNSSSSCCSVFSEHGVDRFNSCDRTT